MRCIAPVLPSIWKKISENRKPKSVQEGALGQYKAALDLGKGFYFF